MANVWRGFGAHINQDLTALHDQIKQRQSIEADVPAQRLTFQCYGISQSAAEDAKPQATQMRTTVGFTAPTTKAPPPKDDPDALFFDTVDSEPHLDSVPLMKDVSRH